MRSARLGEFSEAWRFYKIQYPGEPEVLHLTLRLLKKISLRQIPHVKGVSEALLLPTNLGDRHVK